jgi:DNA-binding transcriptional LysR family regulator
LRIGASPANAEAFLPEACSTLLMEAPKVTLNVAVLDNDALLPALRKGDLDIAVTHTQQFPQPDLTQELFREDEFVVFCALSHPLAKRKSVTLEDLAQERWASTAAAHAPWGSLHRFRERGLPAPRTTLVSNSVILRLRAVAGSDLVGISVKRNIDTAATQLRLKILPVKGLDWVRPVAIVYRKDAYLSPAARRFIEILKAAVKGIAAENRDSRAGNVGQEKR